MLAGQKGRVSLIVFEGGAQLALRLLQATQKDHGLKELNRLVLLRPRISAAAVNTLLAKTVNTHMVVDVFYESEMALEKRDVMLRHAYAKGSSRVLAPEPRGTTHWHGAGLYVSLLSNRKGLREGASEEEMYCMQVDPEEADAIGQSVFWSELTFEMSRSTKMLTTVFKDLDPYEIAQATVIASAPPAQAPRGPRSAVARTALPPEPSALGDDPCGHLDAASGSASAGSAPTDASSAASWVGALVLRGNRCVLVRSLASPPEWTGMRIPYVERASLESPLDAAVRAASELCDIEGDAELEILPLIPPAILYVDGSKSEMRRVFVYALYAVQPPPDLGSLEDADLTDDEDLYDWYTWPRMLHALRHDPCSISAMRNMASALATAAEAGHLPCKWGGIFGQESLEASPPEVILSAAPDDSLPPPIPSAEMVAVLPAARTPALTSKTTPATARDSSGQSHAGHSSAETHAQADAQIATDRAAEDAAIARKRFEEDAALAARRARQDDERSAPPPAEIASRLLRLEAKVDQILALMAGGMVPVALSSLSATPETAATEVTEMETKPAFPNAASLCPATDVLGALGRDRVLSVVMEAAEFGISSFIFRARRPFHPERLHAALGSQPRPGALSSLLRLKGIAWLASQYNLQGHAALAGSHFTVSPGSQWWAAVAREEWPEGLEEDIRPLWDEAHGDRQSELVCIGQELDHAAARAMLDRCLLTDEEMAAGVDSWAALVDPFRVAWDLEITADEQEDDDTHTHDWLAQGRLSS